MADAVLDLARRLLELDQEAIEVRAKLKAALLNGAGGSEAPPFEPRPKPRSS
jgi:hypothetical protein